MLFEQLGLTEPLLMALRKKGYTTPSPIQQKAIPPAIKGNDILGLAQTGTGKTAAFAIPILELLNQRSSKGYKHIRALILAPTRELAIQINDSFESYGSYTKVQQQVIYGGVSQHPQTIALRTGTDVLIATPGRLLDLISQGYVNLDHLEILVLDEVDRMLDMGFIRDVQKILRLLPKQKQTMLFSATMPPEIAKLSASLLTNPVRVQVTPTSSTVEKIDQYVYFIPKQSKQLLLVHLLNEKQMRRTLVFTRTKHNADRIAKELKKASIHADAIHGNKSQSARQNALVNFKRGKLKVLVATDIAARGIDVDALEHVINFDLPEVAETYVHRIGRTGRAGATGVAISFCDDREEMGSLKSINKLIGQKIPAMAHPFETRSKQNR
jgi:ATP-dependent RNA helicase RhlE